MIIKNVRPVKSRPSAKGFVCLCAFNLEINPSLLFFDFQLIRSPTGDLLVYPPTTGNGSRMAAIAPDMRREIAALVFSELQKCEHHDEQPVRAFA